MTPIEKNIIVVDEQGNVYEATYPKRAMGLVKNGRARFIEENKICLLCPPEIEMEDNKMSENKKVNENVEVNSQAVASESKTQVDVLVDMLNLGKDMAKCEADEKMTIGYVLGQIEKIQSDTLYLQDCIKSLEGMRPPHVPDVVDIAGEQKAKALAQVVTCRETTNQRLIAFYEKIYDDLKPSKPIDTERIAVLSTLTETLGEGMTPVECKEALTEILGTALQDFSKNI